MIIGDPECTRCKLSEGVYSVCMLGERTEVQDRIMIIGEAPNGEDDFYGEPFQGATCKFLEDCLEYAEVDRDHVYITNVVKCNPPGSRNPTASEIQSCNTYLREEIEDIKPTHILLLGAIAAKAVLGIKNFKDWRSKVVERDGITYKITNHPSYGLSNQKAKDIIREDIRQFFKLIYEDEDGYITAIKYKTAYEPKSFKLLVNWLEKQQEVSWDIESTGLDPFADDADVVSMGFSNGSQQWVLLLNHPLIPVTRALQKVWVLKISRLLKNKHVYTHAGKFDSVYTAKKYNTVIYPTGDTQLLYHLIDENASLELKNILSREFKYFYDYNVVDDIKMGKSGGLEEHCQYLASDVYYTFKLYKYARRNYPEIIKIHDLLSIQVAKVYIDAELNGVYRDPVKTVEAQAYWKNKEEEILTLLGFDYGIVDYSGSKKPEHEGSVNLNSPKQLADLLFNKLKLKPFKKTANGSWSTSVEVLLELAEQHPLPKLILNLRGVRKNLQFLNSWIEKTDAKGFVHPKFNVAGTTTGRPSSEDPNFQQTPREVTLRACWGAPPGYVLIDIDYSQIELRLAADDAREATMIYLYNHGADIHVATVQDIFGIKVPNKEERTNGKMVNFGFIYGLLPKGFVKYAFLKFGRRFTIDEATRFRDGYFNKYKGLLPWHEKKQNIVRECGYVTTWTGRRRHLPAALLNEDSYEVQEAFRQAINAPIQGGAAELTLAAMVEIWKKYKRHGVIIIGSVHDSLLMYIPENKTDKLVPGIINTMVQPELLRSFGKTFKVPIEVEAKIGNWGIGKVLDIK